MKHFYTVSAVFELGGGLALLGVPSATAQLLVGAALQGPVPLTVARVGGGGLFALGLACWHARGDAQNRAARGVAAAMLSYNVLVAAVLAFAGLGLGLHGLALWPAVVLHAAMAVWCVVVLVR